MAAVCRAFFLMAAAMAVALTWSLPSADAQNEGLEVTSTKTYTPETANEHIVVEASYTMTNVQPDEIIGDSVRSFYFTSWVVAIPVTVTDFAATSNGAPLIVSVEPDDDTQDISFATISLPFNLDFQETVTLDVTYTIPGGEPRASGAVARVNDSFLSFPVWTAGDPNASDVRVNVPAGFTLDLEGSLDGLSPRNEDGVLFFEAIDISEPRQFFGQVFGRNDNGLITETAQLSNATATVRAWPDDPDWAAFVVDAIEDDVPIIEELTGLSWPAGDIEVIETVTPYLYGYGGWFNTTSGLIEIGENLERDLILHELTHAWFNEGLIEGRWITEGLAEEYASRTIEASGDVRPDPEQPDLDDPVRVPLADWASPWTLSEDQAFAYEQYHYNASWWVVRQVTNDIGLETFADVLGALNRDELAYAGEGPLELTQLSTRWIHLFDLLDRTTDAEGLDELFETYVLNPDQVDKLETRRTTLGAYDSLVEASGEWGPPLVIRRALSAWDFDEATELIEVADDIIVQRDAVNALAADLQVTIERDSESLFEAALAEQDLSGVLENEVMLQVQLDELAQERLDVSALADALGTRIEFGPMNYDDAVTEIEAQRVAIGATEQLRADVGAAAAHLGLKSPSWPASDGPTDFAAEMAAAEARLATLAMLDETKTVVDEPRSITQQVGLWFSDVDGTYAAAETEYEAGDLDEALTSSAQATSLIGQSATVGRNRLIWSGVIAVALLASIWFLRRTRR